MPVTNWTPNGRYSTDYVGSYDEWIARTARNLAERYARGEWPLGIDGSNASVAALGLGLPTLSDYGNNVVSERSYDFFADYLERRGANDSSITSAFGAPPSRRATYGTDPNSPAALNLNRTDLLNENRLDRELAREQMAADERIAAGNNATSLGVASIHANAAIQSAQIDANARIESVRLQTASDWSIAQLRAVTDRYIAEGNWGVQRYVAELQAANDLTIAQGNWATQRAIAEGDWATQRFLGEGNWANQKELAQMRAASDLALAQGAWATQKEIAAGDWATQRAIAEGNWANQLELQNQRSATDRYIAEGDWATRRAVAEGDWATQRAIAEGQWATQKEVTAMQEAGALQRLQLELGFRETELAQRALEAKQQHHANMVSLALEVAKYDAVLASQPRNWIAYASWLKQRNIVVNGLNLAASADLVPAEAAAKAASADPEAQASGTAGITAASELSQQRQQQKSTAADLATGASGGAATPGGAPAGVQESANPFAAQQAAGTHGAYDPNAPFVVGGVDLNGEDYAAMARQLMGASPEGDQPDVAAMQAQWDQMTGEGRTPGFTGWGGPTQNAVGMNIEGGGHKYNYSQFSDLLPTQQEMVAGGIESVRGSGGSADWGKELQRSRPKGYTGSGGSSWG